jgi:hypothetical protein
VTSAAGCRTEGVISAAADIRNGDAGRDGTGEALREMLTIVELCRRTLAGMGGVREVTKGDASEGALSEYDWLTGTAYPKSGPRSDDFD